MQKWEKKRIVSTASCKNHGPVEPVAFLHAFRDGVIAGDITNVRASPPTSHINNLVALHRNGLEALVDLFK